MTESTVQLSAAKPLPHDWWWVKLGDVCEINPSRPSGFSRPMDARTTFVPMVAVDEKLGIISKPEVRSYSEVSVGYTYFEEGDVLFAKITPCMQNGKHAIARNLIDSVGFGSTEFHVLRPTTVVLPEWIYFFLRQPAFLTEAESYFVGAVGQQRVPEIFLINYHIPLPPLPEQKRIATKIQELIAEVERAHAACEAQLEAAKALPPAYLRQVFESDEAKKWERWRLGEVCEFSQYGLTAIATSDSKGFPYLRITDIDDSGNLKIDAMKFIDCDEKTLKNYALEEGDILFARSGSIGRTFLYSGIPANAVFASYLIRFKLKQEIVEPFYLFYFTRSPAYYSFIEEKKHIVSQPNINAKEYGQLLIPIPTPSEQKRIATELKDKIASAEKLKASIEKQLEAIKTLPQAILRKAFSGEL
jgi:type I restriction enzyme S subunit